MHQWMLAVPGLVRNYSLGAEYLSPKKFSLFELYIIGVYKSQKVKGYLLSPSDSDPICGFSENRGP